MLVLAESELVAANGYSLLFRADNANCPPDHAIAKSLIAAYLPGLQKARTSRVCPCHPIGVKIELPSLCCSLSELGEIEIVPVTSRYCKNASVWRALLDEHHYLESSRLSGEQIRYVIKSSRHGYLGAMAFSAAKWSLSARDKYIGWSEETRIENLRYVVTNDRFLIVPTVRVKNLASHVLAMALRHLPEDFYNRPQANIPEACGTKARAMGNRSVSPHAENGV